MSSLSKDARDNRADQLNPAHPAFYLSRGASPDEARQMADSHRASTQSTATSGSDPSVTVRSSDALAQPVRTNQSSGKKPA